MEASRATRAMARVRLDASLPGEPPIEACLAHPSGSPLANPCWIAAEGKSSRSTTCRQSLAVSFSHELTLSFFPTSSYTFMIKTDALLTVRGGRTHHLEMSTSRRLAAAHQPMCPCLALPIAISILPHLTVPLPLAITEGAHPTAAVLAAHRTGEELPLLAAAR